MSNYGCTIDYGRATRPIEKKEIAQHCAIVKPAVRLVGVDDGFKSRSKVYPGPHTNWW